jgi:CRP-like cAMP-binding protein
MEAAFRRATNPRRRLAVPNKGNYIDVTDLFPRNDSLVAFKPGQAIFKEGEQGEVMFILVEGTVDVLVGDKLVGTFEPIESFGEMAVIDPGPRSATVVAKTHCRLGAVNQKRFKFLAQNKPEFAFHVMRMLVERMRWMDHAAQSTRTVEAEKIARLEEKISELNAIIKSQEDRLCAWQPAQPPVEAAAAAVAA